MEEDDPIIRCRVEAPSLESLRAFAAEVDPDLGCRPVARRTGAGFRIDVYLPRSQVDRARAARSAGEIVITEVEDFTETSRQRREEVGERDRFAQRGAVPRGLGTKE